MNSTTTRRAYCVLNNDDYFGRDFALAEACRTIDRIVANRRFINH
ncbi:DUF4761 family protein [Klebsiella oxytoca]|nr:DUF4761 family protein [Klebsiella oxytoca]